MKAEVVKSNNGTDEIQIRFGSEALRLKAGASSVSPLLTHEKLCQVNSIINMHCEAQVLLEKVLRFTEDVTLEKNLKTYSLHSEIKNFLKRAQS